MTVLRLILAGFLLALNAFAFMLLFEGRSAVAAGLPQEFLGFRLGERIAPMTASSWGVTIKGRTMVRVDRYDSGVAPPLTPGMVLYQECSVRVETRCPPGPQNYSADRPDTPGSLKLFVASFEQDRLLGLAYDLNRSRWDKVTFDKAEESLRQTYGRPVKSLPPKQEVIQTPQMKVVSASTWWQWEDHEIRLRVMGSANNLPGTNIGGMGNLSSPDYSYFLYAERLDLRRLADQRTPKKAKEQ